MKSSTSNHTIIRRSIAGATLVILIGGSILLQRTPDHMSPVDPSGMKADVPAAAVVKSEKTEASVVPATMDDQPTAGVIQSFDSADRLHFGSFDFQLEDIVEWREVPGSEGSHVEGILDFSERGMVYFEAVSRRGDEWEVRESAFLGEFVVHNEALPLEAWQNAGYLDSGFIEIVESNRLFTSVRLRATSLDDQVFAMSIMQGTVPEREFEMNTLVFPTAAPNDPNYAGSWTLAKLELEPVWEAYGFSPEAELGRRPVIAVVDNGASETDPDLHMWVNEDEIPGNNKDDDGNGFVDDVTGWNFARDTADLSFAGGHGKTVSRISASLTNNGTGTASPASSGALMRLLYFEDTVGAHFDAVDAMLYAVDNGADVVNCSFVATSSAMFSYVLQAARDVNSIIVAAAGNNKRDLSSGWLYPISLDDANLIGVGASDSADNMGASNYNDTYVDLFAPGGATSYSTPLVTSTVALLRSIKPTATYDEIVTAISAGVDYVPALDGLCVSNGRLNVRGAVEALIGGPISNTDPQDPTPGVPSLNVSAVTTNSISLGWSVSGTVDGFEMEVSQSGSAFAPLEPTSMFQGTERSVVVDNLLEETAYSFRIRSFKGTLNSEWRESGPVTTMSPAPVAPSAPTISVDGTGVGSVSLSWDTTEAVDGFELEASENGAAYASLPNASYFNSNERSATITGLLEGASYRFRIRAIRDGAASNWKNSALATTEVAAPVAPSAPVIAIAGVGVGSVDLTWSSSESVDSFEVQMSEAGAAYSALPGGGVFGANESGIQLTGLGEGVDYRFRIRSIRDGLSSTWAVSAVATTEVSAPVDVAPAMPDIVIESVGVGTVTISWSLNEIVDAFEVEASESGQAYAPLPGGALFSGTETGAQFTGLGQGVSYRFRIRAIRGELTSMWKKSKLATTTEASQGVLTVPVISVESVGIGSVDLSWSASEAVDGFELQMSEAGAEFSDVVLAEPISGTETGMQLVGLSEGVNYAFRIRSVKDGAASDWALTQTVTTLEPAPEAPVAPSLSASLVEQTTVSLSWSIGEAVDGFEIQISEGGSAYVDLEAGLVLSSLDSAILVQDLAEATNYQFRIRAVRSGLYSSWAESALITTESLPWPKAQHNWKLNGESDLLAYDSGLLGVDLELDSRSGVSWGDGIGALETGLSFSGSHKGVEIPDSNAINLVNQKALTISLWVKVSADSSRNTSVIYEQGGFWRGLNLIVDEGWLIAGGWNRPVKESDWAGTTLQGGKLAQGQWNHIVLVLNATETVQDNGLTLYVNGQSVASGPASMLWANMEKTGIGQIQGGTVYRDREVRRLDPFEGSIDDLNIWCCALTHEEIQTIYDSAFAN